MNGLILSNRLAQNQLSDCRCHLRGLWMAATQSRDLQERFTGSGKHSKQVAFFGASLPDDLRPFGAAGPTHRSARGRKVQLWRWFETVLPLFSRDFESEVFETRQRSH